MNDEPVTAGIKFPARISVEHKDNLETWAHETWLHFDGADHSRLTLVLSDVQVNALLCGDVHASDPQRRARDLYVAGHIEIDEFERRLSFHDPIRG